MKWFKMSCLTCVLILLFTSFNFPSNKGQNALIFKLVNTSNNKYCTIVEIVNVTTKKKYKSSWLFFNDGFSTINKVPAGTYYISKAYYIAGGYSNGYKFSPQSIIVEVTNQGVQYFGEYRISKGGIAHVSKETEYKNLKLLSNYFNTEYTALGWTFHEEINYTPLKL